jgi:hypothetical protein
MEIMMLQFILMLSGAMLWTGVLCAAAAYAVYKLMQLEDKE